MLLVSANGANWRHLLAPIGATYWHQLAPIGDGQFLKTGRKFAKFRHWRQLAPIGANETAQDELLVSAHRQLAISPIGANNWRQLAPIGANHWRQIGAKLAPIAHRQYIGANWRCSSPNWRQLAPIIGANHWRQLARKT